MSGTGPVYASVSDLARYGIKAQALAAVPVTDQQAAIEGASRTMDSFFRARYALPFSRFGEDVTRICCHIASYDLLVTRGYNPAAGADVNIRLRHEDAMTWLRGVSRQDIHPDVTPMPHESPGYDDPMIITDCPQGWIPRRR